MDAYFTFGKVVGSAPTGSQMTDHATAEVKVMRPQTRISRTFFSCELSILSILKRVWFGAIADRYVDLCLIPDV